MYIIHTHIYIYNIHTCAHAYMYYIYIYIYIYTHMHIDTPVTKHGLLENGPQKSMIFLAINLHCHSGIFQLAKFDDARG